MRHINLSFPVLLALFLAIPGGAQATVRLPAIISDGMVLQSGKPIALWGWADPGEKVRVSIAGKEASATAGPDGKWSVKLPALEPQGPLVMTVRGENALKVGNVLIGEVWVASGQSNMGFRLSGALNAGPEIAAAHYPKLRFFLADENFSQTPAPDVKGRWLECTPANAPAFSAVAYFFGRDLHKELGRPVGLIISAVGGTRIESWMSSKALDEDPMALEAVAKWRGVSPEEFQKIGDTYRKFQQDRSAHATAAAEAKKKGLTPPPAPVQPSLRCHDCPSSLWNGMVSALAGYGIRGFIWYQGESNTSAAERYDSLFPAMIRQWRGDWQDEHLPFYYVQLANYAPSGGRNGYARLRESQRRALQIPDTGMAVAIDVGEANDIHPKNKQEVGRRLSLWALNRTYGRKSGAFSGPLFESMKVEGNTALLRFSHADRGLVAKGNGPLTHFEVAGADGQFVPASAEISGDQIRVSSDKVSVPVTVRYAWADNPEGCNLFNGAGLPASPFTTAKNLK